MTGASARGVSGVTIAAIFGEQLPTQLMPLDRQVTSLAVSQPESFVPLLLSKDAVLFTEELDRVALPLVPPARNDRKE